MNPDIVLLGLASFFGEIILQKTWIRTLKHSHVVQILKTYGPQRHLEQKVGTPTMGGIVFVFLGLITILATFLGFGRSYHGLAGMMVLPIGEAFVGFLDDWLKFTRSSSEGLSSRQKLMCQIAVVVPWTLWVHGTVGIFLFPEMKLGAIVGSALLAFLAVGFLNAVNITDGLDGLAGGCCLISFAAALMWLDAGVSPLCVIALGITGGFLWHNCHPAKVFMGDVGAHFLGGILISIAVWSHYLVALFPLAFVFGLETLSVILQLTSLKLINRRIFRMSPIHHHFELIGWSEPQVVTRFWLVHASGLALLAFVIEIFRKWF